MAEQEAAAENNQGQFALQRIYVKDLSFESPGAPAIFAKEWKPDINLQLNTAAKKIDSDANLFEVVLSVTVTLKSNDEVAYLIEVQQAGVFVISGVDEERIQHLLGSYCPNLLFPYARETVSDMVTRGSFPQMLLSPVNFDALFAEAKKRQAEQEKAGETTQ